jgi:hypothetical protein
MARKILTLGPSGSGKSTAIENLDPKETFIILPDSKGLPFKGWKSKYTTVFKEDGKLDIQKSNLYETKDPPTILALLKAISAQRSDIKVIIIDTITMMMDHSYMNRAKEKGFDKYTDLALEVYNILASLDNLRQDLTCIIIGHVQNDYDAVGEKRTSFKVIGGKLIGEKIEVEGMFNEVFYSEVVMEDGKPNYYFRTQSNGKDTCKSSRGLFDELYIPNDFKFILDRIKEFEQN